MTENNVAADIVGTIYRCCNCQAKFYVRSYNLETERVIIYPVNVNERDNKCKHIDCYQHIGKYMSEIETMIKDGNIVKDTIANIKKWCGE